jgi:GNAT superfamily N-acetyltransferase
VTCRPCRDDEREEILAIVNAAAEAYRGVIPADRWQAPYMPAAELDGEIAAGVRFWGYEEGGELIGAMGIQRVDDVELIRHAYVRPDRQRRGVGAALLSHLRKISDGPVLVGTWADARWAVDFYRRHGFVLASPERSARLLRRYWAIPDRQVETSVVLELRPARVAAVARGSSHGPGKELGQSIRLVAGIGVEGDVHAGETVKHRSRVRRDPAQPNLRQVHLIHSELHDELRERGFDVGPGEMGENVTTAGIDLLGLARGTRLRLGGEAVIEVTGLRNPCTQLNGVAPGLMEATLDRDANGELIRKAGVMAVVVEGGQVGVGDAIAVEHPPEPHARLEPV